jgi:hypothetical protein
MSSLWPEFTNAPTVSTPVSMLKEQAAALGEQFKNQIHGSVQNERNKEESFIATFYIRAPALNYRFRLFRVIYGFIDIYPALGIVDGDIAIELTGKPEEAKISISNEQELSAFVGRVFASEKTGRVIGALRQHLQA